MADENDDVLDPNMTVTPGAGTPERAFVPAGPITATPRPSSAAPEPERRTARRQPRGIPRAQVDPTLVHEFEKEIETKVTSGRKRMRWFANHLILFVAAVAAGVPLHLFVFADIPRAFLLVPLGAWVGLLAIHANYAMNPLMRKSAKETQLKAVIPPSGNGEGGENGSDR